MIEIKNLSKRYKNGTLANCNINLFIQKGEILGILGPNGAGKTTLIRQLVGLSKSTSGIIVYDNKYNMDKNRDKIIELISFFNQKTILLKAHRVYEVIFYTGIYRGLKNDEAKKETRKLMSYFHIDLIESKRINVLSGGQAKLVMLAATFIGKRQVIILDEPTNDLDPLNRIRLWSLIKQYNDEHRTTFIIVSHNLTELETVVNQVAIIQNGKLVEHSGLINLKNKYNTGFNISLKCENETYDKLKDEVSQFVYEEINSCELILSITEKEIEDVVKKLTPIITCSGTEMKIYRNTLSNIYNILQEEHDV